MTITLARRPMPKCSTCRWWGHDASAGERDSHDPTLWARARPCGAMHFDGWDSGPHPVDIEPPHKAQVVDGSGYYASLRTAADFGCVLHEAK